MSGFRAQVATVVRVLVQRWESIQVELHGSYSVERLVSMKKYRESTCVWRSLMVLGTLPLLPLICAAVVDALPMQSPDLGLAHSGTVWVRGTLVTIFDSYALSWMFCLYVPELDISGPFNIIFQQVTAVWQTPVAALVPVFKIIQKNAYCRLLRGKDDLKPELVTFNIEVTHALFISSTMQHLQSVKSSAMLTTLDFIQMLTSVFDLSLMLKNIRNTTNESTDQAIACALKIASRYPELTEPTMPTKRSFISKSDIFRLSGSSTNSITNFAGITRVAPIGVESNIGLVPNCPVGDLIRSQHASLKDSASVSDITTLTLVEQMSPQQRHSLLHKVLQVMFFVEFLLLTEFSKAIIPAAYSEWLRKNRLFQQCGISLY
ncbi:unnamed protein product [Phytophthora fragariaefolia]|uniref:Unnamed protein product n=1 Tax=Phytophthora fragariaefolia TaxID=1490495 RepID=A0A9W6U2H7_9STRA|nr:unnamed protein product [Phytophthora fragariaefolia]